MNKEVTRDRFHEIGPSLLEWRLLAPILNLTPLDVEDIEKDNRGEESKRDKFLSVWKRKQCVHATYRALVVALCKIERREYARKVCEVLKGELYLGLARICRTRAYRLLRRRGHATNYLHNAKCACAVLKIVTASYTVLTTSNCACV